MSQDYRRLVEHGRYLRSFVNEPGTTLVRQEDLAFCASRLLLLCQYSRRDDRALADLIESSLQDLAQLNPDSSIRRIRDGLNTWESSPVYWALCCHVLAHVLSEFTRETPATTVTELRGSLGDWFPRFRHSLETKGAANDGVQFVCYQVYLTQCAIFHDAQAMNWCSSKLLSMLGPERLAREDALETAALLAGVLLRGDDLASRSTLALMLDRAAVQSPVARSVREQLSDLIPSRPEHVIPSASHSAVPKMEMQSSHSRRPVKPRRKRERHTGLFGKSGESLAPFVPWVLGLAIIGGCIWGMGQFFDYFENTSNVGQVSLGDWYRNAEKQRENDKNKEEQKAVESGVVSAAPTVDATPVESPSAPADRLVLLDKKLTADVVNMKTRILIPRSITIPSRGENTISVYGEYIDHRIAPAPEETSADVVFRVRWYENNQVVGEQSIDANYRWNGSAWQLGSAARSISSPGIPKQQKIYLLEETERKWAESLFAENPFYAK